MENRLEDKRFLKIIAEEVVKQKQCDVQFEYGVSHVIPELDVEVVSHIPMLSRWSVVIYKTAQEDYFEFPFGVVTDSGRCVSASDWRYLEEGEYKIKIGQTAFVNDSDKHKGDKYFCLRRFKKEWVVTKTHIAYVKERLPKE